MPGEIDLTHYYNARLDESWHGNQNNDLSSLPTGLQTFNNVQFDVRGIVQLGSRAPTAKKFPPQIKGIKVRQKCRRLHFLHAAGYGGPGSEGKQIGTYIIHFAIDQMRLEIPIVYGKDVRDWHKPADEKPSPKELTEAWDRRKRSKQSIQRFDPAVRDDLGQCGAWRRNRKH